MVVVSSKLSEKVVTTLAQSVSAKEKKQGQTSGSACTSRVQNKGLPLNNGVDMMYFMRENKYDTVILQMAWFKCRILFFRQILHNVGRRQVASSMVGAKYCTKMQWRVRTSNRIVQTRRIFFFLPPARKKREYFSQTLRPVIIQHHFRS